MSEEGGRGGFLLWENQPLTAALPNSDNANNDSSGGTGTEDKSAGKTDDQQPQPPLRDSTNTRSNKRGAESYHDNHIWTERERRRKMRNMFSGLQDLLPHLQHKADKSSIVDEAVSYIKTLERTLQNLEKQKEEKLQGCIGLGYHEETPGSSSREAFMADGASSNNKAINKPSESLSVSQSAWQFQTWTSPNVVLNICGKEAQISVCSPKKPGLFATVCCILEKHRLEVTSAQVSSDSNRCMLMIQAHIWDRTREREDKVEWQKVVWFFSYIPKHSIVLWMTILNKLPTRDKLIVIGISVKASFLFCNTLESRNHLFFKCSYVAGIWEDILKLCNVQRCAMSWDEEICWVVTWLKRKSLVVYILKLTWTTCIYSIWSERNCRFFRDNFRTPTDIVNSIKDIVCVCEVS
ncbi:hypothetical protein GQ457_10G020760 [Hibiscus cannabinus]